jgi:hypothetical protein
VKNDHEIFELVKGGRLLDLLWLAQEARSGQR